MKIIYNVKWIPKKIVAIALPNMIITRHASLPQWVIDHEAVHHRQWRKCLYVFYLPLWALGCLIAWLAGEHWYFGNPFERNAFRYGRPYLTGEYRNESR